MKVTRKQLDELIGLITKQVLKEYGSMMSSPSSTQDDVDPGTADDGAKPPDAMTSAEKSKQRHDQMLQNKKELDMAKQTQRTEKQKADSYKAQYDQWSKYGKSQDDKNVKDLAAKVATRMAENIRKLRG